MAGPGFHPHAPAFRHRFLGTFIGATMWFWIFVKARSDGPKLLGRHPWEGHGHGHGHGDVDAHKEHH